MTQMRLASMVGCVVMLAGCIANVDSDVPADDELVGESASSIISENALNLNALNLNALNLNALNLNALNLNGLSVGNLAAIQDPGSTGNLARQAMRYMVSCAFMAGQSFSFTWTDGSGVNHPEVYPGLLGVAPTWAFGPLSVELQRMVSACLAARVNWYQVPVIISARSQQEPLKTLSNALELINYADVEGAFWGNLFASQPFINACYNSSTVSNSRAWQRDCAVGHLGINGQIQECGMIHIAGPCSNICEPLNGAGKYYPSCIERPGVSSTTTKQVVTTALP